jgi:hypothetical protein
VGEVFYQLVITAGMTYSFSIILDVLQSKILAKLAKYTGIVLCASYVIKWVLLAFQVLNDKCDNWFIFKVF